MNALVAVIAVIVILGLILLAASIKIVQEYERGVIFRLGRSPGRQGSRGVLHHPGDRPDRPHQPADHRRAGDLPGRDHQGQRHRNRRRGGLLPGRRRGGLGDPDPRLVLRVAARRPDHAAVDRRPPRARPAAVGARPHRRRAAGRARRPDVAVGDQGPPGGDPRRRRARTRCSGRWPARPRPSGNDGPRSSPPTASCRPRRSSPRRPT